VFLTIGGKTDSGRMRAGNEDRIYFSPRAGLAVVADGMGGHAAGETASRLAVGALRDHYLKDAQKNETLDASRSETTNRLGAAIGLANRAVYEAAQNAAELKGMGTTIAAAALDGNQLSFAHVGDSRIYLVRSGSITQLTEDHSLASKLSANRPTASGRAGYDGMNHILTRALGTEPAVRADLGELTVLQGDLLILCTDGLYNMVSEEEILEIVIRAGNVHAACEILVDAANDNGGLDNISVIVGFFRERKWYPSWSKFMNAFRG